MGKNEKRKKKGRKERRKKETNFLKNRDVI